MKLVADNLILRGRIARALYDHEPVYRGRPTVGEYRVRWVELHAVERDPFLKRAEAIVDALRFEHVGWFDAQTRALRPLHEVEEPTESDPVYKVAT